MQSPYIAPSENGGRGGIKWLALLPADAPTRPGVIVSHIPCEAKEKTQQWPILAAQKSRAASEAFQDDASVPFVPGEGLHFSASYHDIMTLLRSKHQHELEAGPCRLHIDGMHMGVGGDDSWTPSVHTSLCFMHPRCVEQDARITPASVLLQLPPVSIGAILDGNQLAKQCKSSHDILHTTRFRKAWPAVCGWFLML